MADVSKWQGLFGGISGRVDLNLLTGTKPLSYFVDSVQNG